MLEWLRQRFRGKPQMEPVDPEQAMNDLRLLASDAVFEQVWELMDGCAAAIESEVLEAVRAEQLGEYPLHAATIWLGYTMGGDDRRLPEDLVERLIGSVGWALTFDENTVLLGAALGALDSLGDDAREQAALRLFADAGSEHARRYWLLLKVRTEALMELVVASLAQWQPDPNADPEGEEYIYSPTAANRMAGAFRQFKPEDFDLAKTYFDLTSPGAQFLVEALGATQSSAAVELLQRAADDERPAVRDAADRWLRVIQG